MHLYAQEIMLNHICFCLPNCASLERKSWRAESRFLAWQQCWHFVGHPGARTDIEGGWGHGCGWCLQEERPATWHVWFNYKAESFVCKDYHRNKLRILFWEYFLPWTLTKAKFTIFIGVSLSGHNICFCWLVKECVSAFLPWLTGTVWTDNS